MDNKQLKHLQDEVKEAKQFLEDNIIGAVGKKNAQRMTENYLNEKGFQYSIGKRETYTMYNLSFDYKNGAISLFIEYKNGNVVKNISIY